MDVAQQNPVVKYLIEKDFSFPLRIAFWNNEVNPVVNYSSKNTFKQKIILAPRKLALMEVKSPQDTTVVFVGAR